MKKEKKQEFTLRITRANKSQMIVILYDMVLVYLSCGAGSSDIKKNRQGFSVIQLPRGIAPFSPIDKNKCLQTCVWCDILDV